MIIVRATARSFKQVENRKDVFTKTHSFVDEIGNDIEPFVGKNLRLRDHGDIGSDTCVFGQIQRKTQALFHHPARVSSLQIVSSPTLWRCVLHKLSSVFKARFCAVLAVSHVHSESLRNLFKDMFQFQ